MTSALDLSWTRFAKAAVLFAAIPILVLFVLHRSGGLEPVQAIVLMLMSVSSLAFLAFRWSRLRAELARGKLKDYDLFSRPLRTVIGNPKHALLWFAITMLLSLAPLAWWAFVNWPMA